MILLQNAILKTHVERLKFNDEVMLDDKIFSWDRIFQSAGYDQENLDSPNVLTNMREKEYRQTLVSKLKIQDPIIL